MRDNEADEAPMKAFAGALGYRFVTDWALMMPLEKTFSRPQIVCPRERSSVT